MKAVAEAIENAVEATLYRAADVAIKTARANTKFKHSNSFDDAIVFEQHDRASGEVISQKDYSYWLEEGNAQSGPIIYPKNAKALHFFVNGEEVFANSVKAHEPYYFMRDAGVETERQIPSILVEELNKRIK